MNFFVISLIISQIGAHGTHLLVMKKDHGPVRISSFLTLFFIGLTTLIESPKIEALQAIFFGSSFIGMSDSARLTKTQLSMASLLFVLIFIFLIHHLKGIGGAIGFSAFVSCLVIYSLSKMITELKDQVSSRRQS